MDTALDRDSESEDFTDVYGLHLGCFGRLWGHVSVLMLWFVVDVVVVKQLTLDFLPYVANVSRILPLLRLCLVYLSDGYFL